MAARVAIAVATAAALAAGPATAHAQTSVTLQMRIPASGPFLRQLSYNCTEVLGVGWNVPANRTRFQLASSGLKPVIGAYDIAQRRGAPYIKGGGIQFEDPFARRKRPVHLADLGLELNGARAFLTGVVKRGRKQFSAVRRVRLAQMRSYKAELTSLVDARNQPIANTFTMIATGRLTVLRPMARALERARCGRGRNFPRSRPMRAGVSLGTFVAGIRPGTAKGLAGDVRYSPGASTDQGEVTIEPMAGASPAPGGGFQGAAAVGAGVPLVCTAGIDCLPAPGTTFGVAGGFDMVAGGRRAAVRDLALSMSGTQGSLQQTLTGTLDGAPVTIATGTPGQSLRFTTDFSQRAAAALGVGDVTGFVQVESLFAKTGPA